MTSARYLQHAFSAVELLITLFIASLFLIAGNQLYVYVLANGEEANHRARASNIGYQYLQTKAPTPTNPCSPSSPPAYTNVPVEGLTNVSITITATCPYTSTTGDRAPLRQLTKMTSMTKYGSDAKEVVHAILVSP